MSIGSGFMSASGNYEWYLMHIRNNKGEGYTITKDDIKNILLVIRKGIDQTLEVLDGGEKI